MLKEIRCPDSADQPCRLSGNNLFLIDSVASDQQFAHNAPVPIGFIDSTLNVPHPGETGLFIKLRDDPSIGEHGHSPGGNRSKSRSARSLSSCAGFSQPIRPAEPQKDPQKQP